MYKGTIIEQSLKDVSVLNEMQIIEKNEESSTGWILYTVLASKEQLLKLENLINDYKWYTHFWNDQEIIIVFKDKIFEIDKRNMSEIQKAVEHGIQIGIPEEQLDFLMD